MFGKPVFAIGLTFYGYRHNKTSKQKTVSMGGRPVIFFGALAQTTTLTLMPMCSFIGHSLAQGYRLKGLTKLNGLG